MTAPAYSTIRKLIFCVLKEGADAFLLPFDVNFNGSFSTMMDRL